jgi:hypothetical protein
MLLRCLFLIGHFDICKAALSTLHVQGSASMTGVDLLELYFLFVCVSVIARRNPLSLIERQQQQTRGQQAPGERMSDKKSTFFFFFFCCTFLFCPVH